MSSCVLKDSQLLHHFKAFSNLGNSFPWAFQAGKPKLLVSIAQLQCSGQPAPGCSGTWDTRMSQLANEAKLCLEEYLYYSPRHIFFLVFFSCLARFWNQPRWLRDSAVEAFLILCSLPSGDTWWATNTTPCDEHTPYLQSPTCTEQLYTPYSRNF